jgi:fumarate reductase subunit D
MFSGGGMLAALVLPCLAAILWVAIPLGWIEPPSYEAMRDLAGRPLVRLGLFVLVWLSAFHWAHRFRYTLYDGLQLYHLNPLIAALCYGGAAALTLAAAFSLLFFP